MPYILSQSRDILNPLAKTIITELMHYKTSDHIFALLFHTFKHIIIKTYGKKLNYSQHNEIMGMLSCCQREFERVVCQSGWSTQSYEVLDKTSRIKMVKIGKTLLASDLNLHTHTQPLNASVGDLNYLFTVVLLSLFHEQLDHNSYCEIKQEHIMSVLASLAEFWYTEKTSPYEDLKMELNGKVKPLPLI